MSLSDTPAGFVNRVSQDKRSLKSGLAQDRGTLSRGEWGTCSNGLLIKGAGCHRGQASNRLSQKGLCPRATMRRILKDTDAESGKDFFFLKRKGGRSGREGEGAWGGRLTPQNNPGCRKTSQPEDGAQASRADCYSNLFALPAPHLGSSQTQDVKPPAGSKEARLVFSYVKGVCSIISPWKAD